jgi:lipoyl(octanoyl) transferase
MPACRLIIEPEPHSGAWNMTVDGALLNGLGPGDPAVLRWYRWAEPTLSLGYFQRPEEVAAESRWEGLPVVRRLTGGGAILHDDEWLIRHPYDLYDRIHEAIIAWFDQTWGLPLVQRGTTHHAPAEPTLCFLREDSHDVCYTGRKVLGSAQRRRKGTLLQHGSFALRTSPRTPELPGLCELTGREDFLTARESLATFVAQSLWDEVEPTTWSEADIAGFMAALADSSGDVTA